MKKLDANDPIERFVDTKKAPRFPPWAMVKATFALMRQNFVQFFNIWAATTMIVILAVSGVTFLLVFKMGSLKANALLAIVSFLIVAILALSAIKALIALPIMRIVLGKTYKTCCTQECTCIGRFWFGACTCGKRLWQIGLFSLVSTLLTGGIIRLFFAIRLTPLWGSIATPIAHPLSIAWRLSRGSWWRLFWGFFMIKSLLFFIYYFFLSGFLLTFFSALSTSSTISTHFNIMKPFLTLVIVFIGPIILAEMITMVYSGLSFQFLYETRIIKASQPTPVKEPTKTRKPQPASPKRDRKPKQSDTP